MKSNYLDFLKRIDDGSKYSTLIEDIVVAWKHAKPKPSHIKNIDSHQYTLRILSILKNELKLQGDTLIAASLGIFQHFFKESINTSKSEISQIAKDYLAVTNLPTNTISKQPDSYRSMLLNVGGDLRSVLISMAQCVLDLRFYHQIQNSEKKSSVLNLAKFVHIPLAHRLGFYNIKSGMEDLVLAYEKPEVYAEIKQKLKESEDNRLQVVNEFIRPIRKELYEQGMKFKIKGRTKSIHSIYTKMVKQNTPFEKVFDLWAIRIIINSAAKEEKANCWQAFSVVTNLYTPSLSRLRDWISIPRENGYESLHITVSTPEERFVEVQIRTERMDDEAENGAAAHWRYKGGKDKHGTDFWLLRIRKALEKKSSPLEQDELKSSKFSTELFAFTPQGDLKKLHIGASVLDFAYAVHSEVGSRCVGGVVNGKNAGMKHLLRNGDQVHILTSKNQKPSLDWLNYVASNKAKLRIKRAIDEQGKREADRGKEVLIRRLKNWKIEFNQDLLEKIAAQYDFKNIGDLYRDIYHEKLDLIEVKKFLSAEEASTETLSAPEESKREKLSKQGEDASDILIIDQLDNVNYQLAKCCNPIPGDPIFGFVTISKGISIHRNSCPNAATMRERYPYRIIESLWKPKEDKLNFRAEIFIRGIDRTGIINEISKIINTNMGIPILSINLNSNAQNFQGKIIVKIYDLIELELLLQRLSALEGVIEVYRHI